ncbi:MAG: cupredoxin domain-containing protein [Myxococcaceae bacterium]|nr:cupredoxin domain-containing protein [Myxococcaceae bacterium]
MTPVGKIVKLLLALSVGALVVTGVSGCKEAASPAQAATTKPEAPAPAPPADPKAPRVVEIKVTENGYEPSPITLKKGVPVTLKVTRVTEVTCAVDFHLDEYDIHEKLPLNQTVTITFTPKNTGELKYGCGMGKMVSGRFFVE